MATNFENFKSWYADTLLELYPDPNSGFVILMVTFPLLERYLRHKNGLTHEDNLSNDCMDELCEMFPALPNGKAARNFWKIYRNGILHQVTLSRDTAMPDGWLSYEIDSAISVESDGSFLIHPVLFSKHVLHIIENDFATFEQGSAASTKLPKVKPHPTATKAGAPRGQHIVLGTSTEL